MRSILMILTLVFFGMGARAQSLSMPQLTNLATLGNAEAYNNLIYNKAPFKRLYSQQVNGLTLVYYQGGPSATKVEKIIIGDGVKTNSGVFLHTVTYTTNQVKYILSLIAQAKSAGLNLNFQGADASNNIFLFDNFLFTVKIYITNDNSQGTVEIRQKEYLNYQ